MKFRIIEKNGLFTPQYYQKGYYSGGYWQGFGKPNIKFKKESDALALAELVERSTESSPVKKTQRVIYTNEK